MDTTALLLSRLQFAFTVSFHIIFPSFTIGLAAWLTVLEALHLITGRPAYRRVFEFWLKIFGIAFGMGVVSGIVLAFEFGTNWSELSRLSGPIQGPLLSYETFTAFMLEASFFGVLLFGKNKVRPGFYLFSTAMVALGTTLSAFWIMVNNSWMQYPVGYTIQGGVYVPDDWLKIIFSPVVWVRFPHMLLAAYVTGAFCVAATGAWYTLRRMCPAEARIMLRMGLFLAAILVPVQLLFGHLVGDYVPGTRLIIAPLADRRRIVQVARAGRGWRLTTRGARHDVQVMAPHVADFTRHMIEKEAPDLSRFLIAPMPGLLTKLEVKAGDKVEAGQPIAVVEAMKMENILRATKATTVKATPAKAGDSLAVDQVIVEFEGSVLLRRQEPSPAR